MGLNPKIWGREGWRFIHFVAVTYHPSKQEAYREFFQNLPDILPCPVCGEHFRSNMEKHPPNFKDAKSLFKWTVDMHNLVNLENGKPKYSYKEAFNDLNASKPKNLDYLNAVLFSLTIASVVLLLSKKLYKK
jgi:hypothetical protein